MSAQYRSFSKNGLGCSKVALLNSEINNYRFYHEFSPRVEVDTDPCWSTPRTNEPFSDNTAQVEGIVGYETRSQ